MKLRVIQEESTISLRWTHDGAVEGFYTNFKAVCHDKFSAILQADHMRDSLRNQIEQIAREAYERGYKDGRGKKAKRTVHRSWI